MENSKQPATVIILVEPLKVKPSGRGSTEKASALIENLIDTVIGMELKPGAENPLLDSLSVALIKIEDDNPNNYDDAISILCDFIAIIEAKRGQQISDEQANELVGLAEEVIALLESA